MSDWVQRFKGNNKILIAAIEAGYDQFHVAPYSIENFRGWVDFVLLGIPRNIPQLEIRTQEATRKMWISLPTISIELDYPHA